MQKLKKRVFISKLICKNILTYKKNLIYFTFLFFFSSLKYLLIYREVYLNWVYVYIGCGDGIGFTASWVFSVVLECVLAPVAAFLQLELGWTILQWTGKLVMLAF